MLRRGGAHTMARVVIHGVPGNGLSCSCDAWGPCDVLYLFNSTLRRLLVHSRLELAHRERWLPWLFGLFFSQDNTFSVVCRFLQEHFCAFVYPCIGSGRWVWLSFEGVHWLLRRNSQIKELIHLRWFGSSSSTTTIIRRFILHFKSLTGPERFLFNEWSGWWSCLFGACWYTAGCLLTCHSEQSCY